MHHGRVVLSVLFMIELISQVLQVNVHYSFFLKKILEICDLYDHVITINDSYDVSYDK